jgi:hypothetical protein
MWDISLTQDKISIDLTEKVEQSAQQLKEIICEYYIIKDSNNLFKHWKSVKETIAEAASLALKGSMVSVDLRMLASRPINNIVKLKDCSNVLLTIDEKIMNFLETVKVIASLGHMFSFEKESLNGDRVDELAEKTCEIYNKLYMRINLLTSIGDIVFRKIMNHNAYNSRKIA